MKFLIYVYYFFRSVFLRGFFATIQLLRAEISHEKKFGIKTSAIKKSDSKEFFHYQGASYLVLLKLFKEIYPITKNCEFIDVGCGKGRAIFVAENAGYCNLKGIELDKELVEQASENLQKYRFKRKESVIQFIHANALEYVYSNKPTVYFLFNPFNEEVMKAFLKRMVLATASETIIIYMNPLYKQPFNEMNIEVMKVFKTQRYTEAVIYKIRKKN